MVGYDDALVNCGRVADLYRKPTRRPARYRSATRSTSCSTRIVDTGQAAYPPEGHLRGPESCRRSGRLGGPPCPSWLPSSPGCRSCNWGIPWC